MRIGVDACCWSSKRGFGRFTRELLTALLSVDHENEYVFFVDDHTGANHRFPANAKTIMAKTAVAPTAAASASGHRSLTDVLAMSRTVKRHEVDLFFFPAVYSYFPLFNRATRTIVTIHDLIADHYPTLVFPNRKLMLLWKLKQNLAVQQSDVILTVSDYSKRCITEHFRLPDERVRAIPEGPNAAFTVLPHDDTMARILARHGLAEQDRFLLYVGGVSPHRNLKTLVDAYRRLVSDARFADVKLVLVGDYRGDPFSFGDDYGALQAHIESHRLAGNVIVTGFVEDADLAYVYNAATVLVIPSLEEGFGLPAVEAMACGTPVVSSDRSSLPEILADAGRFFDPHDPEAMVTVFKEVLGDDRLRAHMRARGFERVRHYTWANAAHQLMAIFDEVGTPPARAAARR
jgi:glycosyltransferase involved in cell wall biosynthesis